MFQYAAARAIAIRTGQELVLDVIPGSEFKLHIFTLGSYRMLTPLDAVRVGLPPWQSRRGMRVFSRALGVRHLLPTTFGTFLPDAMSVSGPVVLSGHWQSERYFADVGEAIHAEFTPRELSADAAALRSEMRASSSLAVSFRRGDYLTSVPQEDLPDDSYYTAARELLAGRHVYGFSDDPAWLEDNLTRLFPDATVGSGRRSHGLADELALHATPDAQIIPPSSFSWWAAWLSGSSNVAAPKRWVWDWAAPDVVPDRWHRI